MKLLSHLPRFGTGIGLHRMHQLCQPLLQSPWFASMDPINVVGSSGKGSVAAMLDAMLLQLGIRSGRYTSPHLFRVNERIALGGALISDEALLRLEAAFEQARTRYQGAHPEDEFGAFEAMTWMAMQHFWEQGAQALVLEAGIGGRYDATRLFAGRFAALSSVELEHSQLLGGTTELIAFDKLDIAPAGGTVVVGKLEADLLRRLTAYAAIKQVQLLPIAEHCRVLGRNWQAGSMRVTLEVEGERFEDLPLKLVGEHQVSNLQVALLLLKRWIEANATSISLDLLKNEVRAGLGKLRWPGRMEKVQDAPPVYLDVGHSPGAMQCLRQTYPQLESRPCLLIVGFARDKPASALLKELLPLADVVMLTQAQHRGESPQRLREILHAHGVGIQRIFLEARVAEAMAKGLAYAQEHGHAVLVTGSTFLVAEAHQFLQGAPPEALDVR